MREFRPFNSELYLRTEDDAMLDKDIIPPPSEQAALGKSRDNGVMKGKLVAA